MAVRLLIVDDSPIVRRLLTATARDIGGFETFEAEDGLQGVAEFQRIAPQLVVTDLEMPGMDGLKMVRTLRRMQGGDKTIIAMLTSRDDSESLAIGAGADECLSKPLSIDALRVRLKDWLTPRRQPPPTA